MKADVLLCLWDVSTAASTFGFGMAGLRLCRIKGAPLVVSGVFGISLWIAIGAWLNLFHLLRPGVFFTLAAIGILLAFVEFLIVRKERRHADESSPTQQRFGLPAKLVLGVAVLIVGTLALGGMRPQAWCVDDLEGYAAMAVKAAQLHSIQPDPFCERRVQAGVGGQNFLDTLMYAGNDLRAMPFIDSTFGLVLYALGLWAIGRRWKAPPLGIALALLVLPFASLMKWNLTIVYLSAAAFFALLLLLGDALPTERIAYGRVVAIGIIVGSMCSTKSPNISFLLPFLAIYALLQKFLQPAAKAIAAVTLSMLVAVAVFVPWSVSNKATAGTYLYPLLGLGIHISAYHFIPVPAKMAPLQVTLVATGPAVILLALGLITAWRLTGSWQPRARAAVISYFLASMIAVPAIVYGVGGQSADRYTAPILIPALLVSLLICSATWSFAPLAWRRIGFATQAFAWIYILLFVEVLNREYPHIKTVLYEAVGAHARQPAWMSPFTGDQLKEQFALGARIQASMPPGTTALAAMAPEYLFDFRRNTVYIADWPGMASPPPGLPLAAGPEEQRRFLLQAGVQYIVLSAPMARDPLPWQYFFEIENRKFPWYFFLMHEHSAHAYIGWEVVETLVQDHERDVFQQIVDHSPQVYNDGHIVVARIG